MNAQELEYAIAQSRASRDREQAKELLANGWTLMPDGRWLIPENTPSTFGGTREAWAIMVAIGRAR